ncbi:MAG: CHAP domain-containing protein [Actinobacteria bacterium]|nr:CHAP domain-containing protein [Actinomycetota bacterium]
MSVRLRSPWPFAVAGAGAAAIALVVASLMALFGAGIGCMGGGGTTAGRASVDTAAHEIPAARLHIYMEAGARFDISWPFLASIGVQECGPDGHCGVAPSGCAGAMEIAYVRGSECSPDPSVPTIWETFRVDGDGDGKASILDPADSIFTAARILRQDMGAPPAGGSYHGYYEAACHYYGACADGIVDYAHEVMARAVSFGFGHEANGPAEAPAPAGPSCEGGGIADGGGASAQAIVRIARGQLGTPEVPLGSNCTKYGPCEEWCALFVAWVWQRAGIAMAGGTAPYAYSGTIGEWAEAHGGRVLPPGATPSPGDAVLFGWGPRRSEHVAIVESVFGTEITTIDGNYGDRVSRVGPFLPALAVADGEPAPIYGYAEPPGLGTEGGGGGG